MRILIIGAGGPVGRAATAALENGFNGEKNDLVLVSRKSPVPLDATNEDSVRRFFFEMGREPSLDGVICTFGDVISEAWRDSKIESFESSLKSKFIGQIVVARYAEKHIKDHGFITLTTGITSHELVPHGMAKTIVNRAIEGFVETAALEISRGIRINAVSPGLLEDTALHAQRYFPGIPPVSSARVGREYYKTAYGIMTGKVLRAYE